MVQRTVGQTLESVRAALAESSVPDAHREADELYASVVCGATSAAFLHRDQPIADAVADRLNVAALKRAAGWPQAYAAGRANFRGHWLSVDQRVLIPRPETEGLVDLVLEWLRAPRARTGFSGVPLRDHLVLRPSDAPLLPVVADIGTGSGAIAVALALEAGVAGVIATDVSAEALNVALDNAIALGAKERISFRRGDLLNPLLDDMVDVIVSNPPYLASAEWEALDASVRDFEPRLALDGGADGLEPYRTLAGQAPRSLVSGGLLALEVDARRANETAAIVMAAGFADVKVKNDLAGRPRYVVARRP